MNKKVTVVIPTFNRGFLLKETIPTYLDKNVGEILVIDDCSNDNTEEVVADLKKKYKEIKYIKLEKKGLQVGAKNKGIELANYEYIYFGDDDSLLQEGSIEEMLRVMSAYKADIVGIKALYAQKTDDIKELEKFIQKNNKEKVNKVEKIIDIKKLKVNFSLSIENPMEVPFTQACFMVKRNKIKEIRFDINYKGNCYREETDFLLECNKNNLKIIYTSNATQINFPRILAKGGSHTKNKVRWYFWAIKNNYYFLNKNIDFLNKKYTLKNNKNKLQIIFISELLFQILINLKQRILKNN